MANLNKGSGYGDFEAPATYNHGVPNPNNVNHGVPQTNGGDYNGNSGTAGNGGNGGGYSSQTNFGEYVEPEIYEEHYAGANYDGFQNPQPSSGRPQQQQQRYDDRRYDNNSYGGTRYAEQQRQYSNQQFETMGSNSNYPYQNQQAFDPQTNSGAGGYTRSQPQPNVMPNYGGQQMQSGQPQKFCKWCASAVAYDAVVCPSCGRQIEELKQSQPNMGMNMGQPQVVINNNNNNGIPYGYMPEPYGTKDKGLALLLCLFGGFLGLHKFYEGKIGMGILYLLTGGLCAIGAIVDFFVLLGKPKKYLP